MSEQEFSRILRNLMESAGLTQAELSEATGISKPLISQYLAGKYKPKQQNIYKLAYALNVDPEELLKYDDYITNKVDPKQPYYLDPETAEQAQMLKENPDLRILLDASKHLSPQDIKALIQIVNTMKGK